MALALYQAFGVSGVIAMVSATLGVLCVAIGLLRVETGRQALEEVAPGTSDADGAAVATRVTQV